MSGVDAAPRSPARRALGWSGRVGLSLLGAVVGGVGASAIDALYAASAAVSAQAPGFGALALVDVGLIVPLALGAGAAAGAALVLLRPQAPLTPAGLLAAIRGVGGAAAADEAARADVRARRGAACLLAPPGALAWTITVAHVARRLLALGDPPRVVGASLALAAVVAAALVALLCTRLSAPLARALRGRGAGDPLAALLGSSLLVAALVAWGITSGTPAGEGGLLGILGVLRRQELDLRAPGLLLLVGLGAALGPGLQGRLFAPLAAALALAPCVLTVRAARALDASGSLAQAIERQAPLGKVGLRLLRRGTDRDKDGFSRTFGGGDCDDRDARVYPTAIDEPGNGLDEDCSGSDTPVPVAPPPAPPAGSAGAAGAAGAPSGPEQRAPEGLSVLLITVDTLRADLHFAGNPRELSPSLDALAARSAVFENAVSLASYTGKSVGPMLTGKYPSETHRGWSHFNSFGKNDIMIAERLKAAGIKTLSLQAHWYFERFSGLGRGFDALDTSAFPPAGTQQDNDSNTTSDKLTDAAIKRLSNPDFPASRSFTWVHYLDPHADYLRHPDTPDFGRDMRAQYDHEVAFTDRHIGRLLEFISKQPWADKLAIIVTSDHGEAFGEHKLIRHGFEIYEELIRVPLIVHVPGAEARRIKPRRSLIDLVPTVLDLYRLEPTFGTTPFDFVSGKSLLVDVLPRPGEEPQPRDVFVDMPAGPNNDEKRAFYHDEKKLYVSSGHGFQLFDLAQDPAEKIDIGESNKEALADMKARYDAFRAGLHEVRVKPIPK
jgi:choline-sulfatase